MSLPGAIEEKVQTASNATFDFIYQPTEHEDELPWNEVPEYRWIGTCILTSEEDKAYLDTLFAKLPTLTPEEQDVHNEEMKSRFPLFRSMNTYCTGRDMACAGTCGVHVKSLIHECELLCDSEQWDKLRITHSFWKDKLALDRVYLDACKRIQEKHSKMQRIRSRALQGM
jgi:hypothetical protein